ncbi:cytochrome P450 [Streptomyces sp. NPDC090052]|uniref:cytochrome P450 family protein n=1 Tax=unclassified Streptomyces TaxID=2593676 RepID=UPI00225235C4|nr:MULTISPECIES: cytochrome P450 [unclassified Streptomyces]MCX4722840.1 cytochrome P450 [Streptomyces sp. NBC_01306]WSV07497.1 cytochrome P450 [Streptomyces sp. NBC_01020]WSX45616.1 cytochrome P450 [Streptomyces sp. NBC_00963]WSX66335.1 cytochrome P450 [Streptomyces sp. NBC_00932]
MTLIDLRQDTEDFNANPYPYYEKMRAAGPVHRVRTQDTEDAGVWLVVGHEEARAALNDPRLIKDPRKMEGWKDESGGLFANMLDADPPHHTRLRKLVVREFTARRVQALRPRVQEVTDACIDAMLAAPERTADLVDSLAFPLPMTVICELFGVPDLDRASFRVWSNELIGPTGGDQESAAVREMSGYLVSLIEAKRERPGDDLLSALIRARDEDGDQLSAPELVGMAFLLLVAGHETTVNLISNGVRALLTHPEQLAALRADMSLLDGAVEEMLRYDGPVETATYRHAAEPLRIGSADIAAGDPVLVSLGSADRDPDRFPDADRFDIRRAPQGHLAFGHGIHFCLGAPLARMEGRIAVRTLLERCPDLELDPDGGAYHWIPGLLMHGVRKLPVRW